MPAQYEHIRDSYVKRGKPLKQAKKLAAMTYNAHRPAGVAPVSPHSDAKAKGRQMQRDRQAAKGKKKMGHIKPNPDRVVKGGDPIHGYTYKK